jgi:hypothetical protein
MTIPGDKLPLLSPLFGWIKRHRPETAVIVVMVVGTVAALAAFGKPDSFQQRIANAISLSECGTTVTSNTGFGGSDMSVLNARAIRRFSAFCGQPGFGATWLTYRSTAQLESAIADSPRSFSDYNVVCVSRLRAQLLMWEQDGEPEQYRQLARLCAAMNGRIVLHGADPS